MKKLVCLLVFAMAASCFAAADVSIRGEDAGDGVLRVYYTVEATGDAMVGIGLNFACSDAATADDAAVLLFDPCCPVFPDYAHDQIPPGWDPCDPVPYDFDPPEGTPIAKTDAAGLPGAAVDAFSLCMGRLDPCDIPVGVERILAEVQLVQGTAAYTDVTIAADDLRLGVPTPLVNVTVSGDNPVRVNFAVVTKCMKDTAPEYATWQAWGEPDCWCYARQCRGDVNNAMGFGKWVSGSDWTAFKAAYNKTDAVLAGVANGICADFNHAAGFGKRVSGTDFTVFKAYYNKLEVDVPVCDMTNYNFWK